MPKKKTGKRVQSTRAPDEAAALTAEERAARREQQKREWAEQKRRQERRERLGAPLLWGGIGASALAAVVVVGIVLFAGGGGGSSAPTPVPTRDPRVGAGPVAKTVTVDADDQGQAANPTFSVTTITGKAGDIIEIKLTNIGSVTHNLNVAGIDGEYGTRDDWITTPQSVKPGETGTVLVKLNNPGTYPYHCDFHPDQQKGVLVLN